jgi:group I intron endonuclease
MDKYLVYCHVRPDINEIFYIGKGTIKRSTVKSNRNKYWHNIVNKAGGFVSQILAANLTEKEALNYEILMIKKLKEIGVKLCNMTLGGDGVSGLKHSNETKAKLAAMAKLRPPATLGIKLTEEHKQKLREAKLGKPQSKEHIEAVRKSKVGHIVSKETCDKISKALFGKKLSKEHVASFSKKVICLETNVIYDSAREAARQLNLHPANISKCCNNKANRTGKLHFSFYKALTS